MSKARASAFGLCLIAGASACRSEVDAAGVESALAQREQRVEQRIATSSGESATLVPVAKWILPEVLREISGLALMADGRILTHGDERGRVYVIDPRRGVILKHFSLGKKGVEGDFEGIAVAGGDIFMLTSNGNVYQFREGKDKSSVDYTLYDTKLSKECEFEGIVIEPGTGAFLLACKFISKKRLRDQLLIYRWLRTPGGGHSVSTITVPLAEAVGPNGWKTLHLSDITIDPATGHYVLIAGPQKALVEITPDGGVVRSFPLPGNPQQPEGVAITPDGILIIGDEGVTRPADITLYRWQRPNGATTSQPAHDSAQKGKAGSTSVR